MSFPGLPVIRTPAPAPLEGQDMPTMAGIESNTLANAQGSLGIGLIARGTGAALRLDSARPDFNTLIPHDDAVKQMKDQGYDPSVLPNGDIHQSVLTSIMTVQSGIMRNEDIARRAHLGSTTSFVSGLIGSGGDPLFLALGPIAGRTAAAVKGAAGIAEGASLTGRVITGGVEGAATLGGYTEAEKQFGIAPGDRDITSNDVLRSLGYGAVIGAGVKGAFGKRLDLKTAASLEASGDTAVSPKGAIGKYQIMPNTARQYMGKDFDVRTLSDPAVNAHVAQVVLDDLEKRFPGDKEAQAVAYNAGPGEAEKWIKAGRNDAMLPGDTQKYLAHLRTLTGENPVEAMAKLPPDVKADAAKASVFQAANDSVGNVDPIIKGDTTKLDEAIPQPGSIFTNERLSTDMLDRINKMGETQVQAPTTEGENPEVANLKTQASEAEQEAQHAHEMAFGPGGTSFTTAKGSTYRVEADGTTTRNKAFRPEHGEAEQGLQPKSEKTFYVTSKEADALSLFQTQGKEMSIEQMSDGRIGVRYLSGKDKGKFEARTVVSPKAEPAVGLTPVETWQGGKRVHFGNQITEVTTATPAKEALANAHEEYAKGILPDEDRLLYETEGLPKAIEAAVRCAMVKGSL